MTRLLLTWALWATLGTYALAQSAGNAGLQEAGTTYAHNLATAAHILDERAEALDNNARALAAAQRAHRTVAIPPVPVPEVHVPPAPLPGPPRFSPSLDDWLQAILNAARSEKKPAKQATTLRAAAASLRMTAHAVLAPAVVPPHDIAPTLASILAQPAYNEVESSTEAQVRKSWWELFLEWLAGMIDRIFQGLFGAASATPLFGRIVGGVTIALIALLVVLVVYRLAAYALRRRRTGRADDVGDVLPERVAAAELYARALAAAKNGHYAIAISLAFRAGLMVLDGSGLVAYDAARTAGEYRHAVRRARAAAAPPFDELARAFTMATYAEMPVGESEWRDADRAYRHFEPQIRSDGDAGLKRPAPQSGA